MRLGVELDSFDGHHYISTVAPDGPVAKHGLLRPEDELLEVQKEMGTLIRISTRHFTFAINCSPIGIMVRRYGQVVPWLGRPTDHLFGGLWCGSCLFL